MHMSPTPFTSRLLCLTLGGWLLSACNTPQTAPEPDPLPIVTSPDKVTEFVKSAAQEATSSPATPAPETTPDKDNADSDDKVVLATGKVLNAVEMGASESPRNDGIHDTINDAIVVLQNPAVAMKDFPRDRRHQVDWVQTLADGLINPRADLLGKGKMTELDLDILMKNTQFMPWVLFPHDRHTKWLACSNCHPAIFEAKEGANPISMNKEVEE